MYWVPATIRWIAARSASCPVTGGSGVTPAAFIAAMAPPPVPSLAARTPSTLLLSAVRAWVISVCALSGAPVRRVVCLGPGALAVEHAVGALLEELGVVVGRRAVDEDDAGVRL